MADFYIEKISASGSGKETATIDLIPGLNIITGPSNTGKTCVFRCVDYVFGGDKQPFSENTGYKKVTVAVRTQHGTVTFERTVGENKIYVVSLDDRIESGTYNAKKGKNIISSVWLRLIGVEDDPQIIKNEDFQTRRMTWRTFSHVMMIDEHEVDREESILMPKGGARGAMGKTAFLSSLLYLIYGNDFSQYDTRESKKERAIRKSAVEKYINGELSAIAERQRDIQDSIGVFQGIDVQGEIDRLVSTLAETEARISEAMERSKSLLNELLQKQERLAECSLLSDRYQALRSQYASDIKRLSFIVEGEAVIDQMPRDSRCPFCNGQLPEKQRASYLESARAELKRIVAQLGGLDESEREINRQAEELNAEVTRLTAEKENIESMVEEQLKPKAKELAESLKSYRAYVQLQNELDVIRRLSDGWNTDLRNMQTEDESELKFKPMDQFDNEFWMTMDSLLKEILDECRYVPLVSARLSKDSFDIEVNGNVKSVNQGKGYCAFLNSVVVLAFRKFMADKAKFKPCFFAIDTPLLGFDEGSKSETPESLQRALFQYFIDHQSEGQMLVIENSNTIPKLDYAAVGVNEIIFTRGQSDGRYGFLHGVRHESAL